MPEPQTTDEQTNAATKEKAKTNEKKEPPPPCGDPTGLTITTPKKTSTKVSWNAVSGADNYDVDYKTNAESSWTNAATGTTATSVDLTDLVANTLYNWRVRVNCSGGSGNYAQANFTTAAKKKPGDPYKKDFDGNEILAWEKVIAGLLLLLFTLGGALMIIRYWPDRLPTDGKIAPLYINEPFHVRLACLPDICCPDCIDSVASDAKPKPNAPAVVKSPAATDSPASTSSVTATDSPGTTASTVATTAPETTATTSPGSNVTSGTEGNQGTRYYKRNELLHINTLLLILVGLGGFVGNMIHVATSFTTFVGAGKFKKSWLLWYCIKPFTAAALAIGIYFVFRGGFLNMSDGGASINLYGLMTISLFAGLFTDKATEKLKEVFEVLFRSKEDRPDPLVSKFKIVSISPLIVEKDKVNKMTLTGEKLDTEKFKISINNEDVSDIKISAGTITFDYTIPDTQNNKKTLTVSVKDDKGKEQYTAELTVKEPDASVPGGLKPDEPKPPASENKPTTEKEGSTTTATGTTETTASNDKKEADASASHDDDDDADKTDETGQPIIKG